VVEDDAIQKKRIMAKPGVIGLAIRVWSGTNPSIQTIEYQRPRRRTRALCRAHGPTFT
jgi:hypothetical protein